MKGTTMKSIGIICEYNPFHNGHAHQLHTLRTTYPDVLRIAIMSGSFVQRGEPAYFSKFDRARWAIHGGADVVIELPTVYSLGSAELFCTGAVRLMKALHIHSISFGSELDDNTILHTAAEFLNTPQGQDAIQHHIKTGVSYGTALRQVIAKYIQNGELINNAPNSLLGLEYIRAGLAYNAKLEYIPILRTSNHHEEMLTDELPSGTALRQLITSPGNLSSQCITSTGNLSSQLQSIIPPSIASDMTQVIENGNYVNYNRYHDMIHSLSRRTTPKELEKFGDFSEGIEHLWSKAAQQSSWTTATEEIKSKRYTYARLQRMGAYLTLGITKDVLQNAMEEGPQYARLLAFNDRGRQWLRNEYEIPLIQKWAKAPNELSALGQTMHHIDTLATDIQVLCFHNESNRIGHRDYTYTPQYIK